MNSLIYPLLGYKHAYIIVQIQIKTTSHGINIQYTTVGIFDLLVIPWWSVISYTMVDQMYYSTKAYNDFFKGLTPPMLLYLLKAIFTLNVPLHYITFNIVVSVEAIRNKTDNTLRRQLQRAMI